MNKIGVIAVIVCFIGLVLSCLSGNLLTMIFNGILLIGNLVLMKD